MPRWFISSKNARHAIANGKKKTFKKGNHSIMNRIYERFSNVGNMNMNYAGVPPFNWEMMVSAPVDIYNEEAVQIFCDMDNANIGNLIDVSELVDFKQNGNMYDCLKDQIEDVLTERYGSLDIVYPSIVRYLFTGSNLDKQSHKQMFWRLFGNLAIENLENNLVACRICPKCGVSVPIWSKHSCGEAQHKMMICNICGKTVPRTNSRQIRCQDCQKEYRKLYLQHVETTRKRIRKPACKQKKTSA